MNVALKRTLSAVDLNFNPPAFPLAQLRDCRPRVLGRSRASSRRSTASATRTIG